MSDTSMGDPTSPRDEQYEAEVTDSDELDVTDFPPDRATGVDDLLGQDVTAADSYAPDDLRRRDARLEPDVATADERRAAPLAPDGLTDTDERGEGDWDVVDPGAALTESSAANHVAGDTWPAEEAAVHVVGDDDDGTLR